MGEARDILDRMTESVLRGDADALAKCYANDAVAVTPDYGELIGRKAVVDYFRPFFEAFSEVSSEEIGRHEAGNVAIDEGYFTGTHPRHSPTPAVRRSRPREGRSGFVSATWRQWSAGASAATTCTSTRST